MPLYHLRPDLGFCHFDGCTIVLDIAADRYWRLDAPAGALLDAVAAGASSDIATAAGGPLVELGLLTDRPTDPIATRHLPRSPECSALEGERAIGAPVHLAAEVTALSLWWRARVRSGTLRRNLAHVARRKAALPAPAPAGDVADLAAAFQCWRRWVPLKPLCLPDSLALMAFLLRRGHAVSLVFGVEAHPFSAHCWVQHDAMVLSDALGHATLFRPILAI